MTVRIVLDEPMPRIKPITTARAADVIAIASEVFQVSRRQIVGRRGSGRVVEARQAGFLISREAGHSYPAIGVAFNRDHATVHYGAKKSVLRARTDAEFADRLNCLRTRVEAEGRWSMRLAPRPNVYAGYQLFREVPKPVAAPMAIATNDDIADDMDLLSSRVAAHYAEAGA